MNQDITLREHIIFGNNRPFVLIAGPCMMESEKLVMETAESIKDVTQKLKIPFVFKTSFDKANRSSLYANRGPGLNDGLKLLEQVKKIYDIPVTTDIHEKFQAEVVADVVDIIQIPAFLCRQTDLLVNAAKTGKIVNVKKGQYMAPSDMENVVMKIKESGNNQILLTERGTSFGYNHLVVDMCSIPIMKRFGFPIVFDATHSVQTPGGLGTSTGGNREFVPHLLKAAAAIGVDALFLEVHPNPDKALCDGPNMIKLAELEELLKPVVEIDNLVKENRKTGVI